MSDEEEIAYDVAEEEALDEAVEAELAPGPEDAPGEVAPAKTPRRGSRGGMHVPKAPLSEYRRRIVTVFLNATERALTVAEISKRSRLSVQQVYRVMLDSIGTHFTRYNGAYRLKESARPENARVPGDIGACLVSLLEQHQPMSLEELHEKTRCPRHDLFKLLAGDARFSREHDRFAGVVYWLARHARRESP
jgi:hypothetical protein